MQAFNVQWKWNVPNALSLLRLALVPTFSVLYLLQLDYWAFGALALSGITDFLDGFIARRFNQITDCGKLLDPLADKLTQVMVVVCLTTRFRELLPLTVICFIKELCQAVGGMILLHSGCQVRGSKWFGKVATVYAGVGIVARPAGCLDGGGVGGGRQPYDAGSVRGLFPPVYFDSPCRAGADNRGGTGCGERLRIIDL